MGYHKVMGNKIKILLIACALFFSGSGITLAATGNETLSESAMIAEINALLTSGKSLSEAMGTLSDKYQAAIQNKAENLSTIYAAMSSSAAQNGIEVNSIEFTAAMKSITAKMINQLGISEGVVVGAATIAGIDVATITNALPATASGGKKNGSDSLNFNLGSGDTSSTSGNSGSPVI